MGCTMKNLKLERVLLVAGAQNTGKSTQLRSMFLDPRFGSNSRIPDARRVAATYRLSAHRNLYLRLTSPHEYGDELDGFLDKIAGQIGQGRWNFACAVQVNAENNMPPLVDVVPALATRFKPERIRVALLSPDRHGVLLKNSADLVDSLWSTPTVEVVFIDARSRDRNGLLLADTFDFS